MLWTNATHACNHLQVCLDEVSCLLRLYGAIVIVVQLMMKRLDGSQPRLVSLAHSRFKGSIFRIPINSLAYGGMELKFM